MSGMSSVCPTCGLCCRSYIVTVCGRDVWEISRQQRLAPTQFIMAVPQAKDRADGFRLEAEGQNLQLMLDKQGRFELDRPCIFLVQLAGQHVTCGVYEHRPVVCRAYPFVSLEDGAAGVRTNALCPPEAWVGVEPNRPPWRDVVSRSEFEFELYGEVTARWNERVASLPGRRFALDEYCSYLLLSLIHI